MIPWFRIVKRRVRRVSRRGNTKDSLKRKAALLVHRDSAKALALSRLKHFNQFYNFKFGDVKIKSQTTRWGSCSSKGNLNFSYKIVLLPQDLADYLVVHELCHLGEFNHSKKFWDLVAKTIPNFKEKRDELKKNKLD